MEVGFHTFPNGKQYAYVMREGRKIFLRNALFLRNAAHKDQIAVVRTWGAKSDRGAWEPPKGQVEWSEFAAAHIQAGSRISYKSLVAVLRSGALRELREEAKLLPSELHGLTLLPTIYMQSNAALRGSYFMYVFWTATVTNAALQQAARRMAVFSNNRFITSVLPHDVWEKDAIKWWSPTADGWEHIRGEFSEKMTRLFYS